MNLGKEDRLVSSFKDDTDSSSTMKKYCKDWRDCSNRSLQWECDLPIVFACVFGNVRSLDIAGDVYTKWEGKQHRSD